MYHLLIRTNFEFPNFYCIVNGCIFGHTDQFWYVYNIEFFKDFPTQLAGISRGPATVLGVQHKECVHPPPDSSGLKTSKGRGYKLTGGAPPKKNWGNSKHRSQVTNCQLHPFIYVYILSANKYNTIQYNNFLVPRHLPRHFRPLLGLELACLKYFPSDLPLLSLARGHRLA